MTRTAPNRTATRKPVDPVLHQLRRVAELADELDTYSPPLHLLADLRRLRDQANRAIDAAMVRARDQGEYWPAIGGALGVSPQAVQQRVRALTASRPATSS